MLFSRKVRLEVIQSGLRDDPGIPCPRISRTTTLYQAELSRLSSRPVIGLGPGRVDGGNPLGVVTHG